MIISSKFKPKFKDSSVKSGTHLKMWDSPKQRMHLNSQPGDGTFCFFQDVP